MIIWAREATETPARARDRTTPIGRSLPPRRAAELRHLIDPETSSFTLSAVRMLTHVTDDRRRDRRDEQAEIVLDPTVMAAGAAAFRPVRLVP